MEESGSGKSVQEGVCGVRVEGDCLGMSMLRDVVIENVHGDTQLRLGTLVRTVEKICATCL